MNLFIVLNGAVSALLLSTNTFKSGAFTIYLLQCRHFFRSSNTYFGTHECVSTSKRTLGSDFVLLKKLFLLQDESRRRARTLSVVANAPQFHII